MQDQADTQESGSVSQHENQISQSGNKKGKKEKLGVAILVFLSTSSIVGGGVFNLIGELAIPNASVLTIAVSFIVSFLAMFIFSKILSSLAMNKPEIKGSLGDYAKLGFGNCAGFLSVWGYWLFVFISNVALIYVCANSISLILAQVGFHATTISIFLIGTVVIIFLTAVNLMGINTVGVMSAIISIIKFSTLAVFIICSVRLFNSSVFMSNLTSVQTVTDSSGATIVTQSSFGDMLNAIRNSMLALLFCYTGIEESAILAHEAKSRKTVKKATSISLGIVAVTYFFMIFAPLCVKSIAELQGLPSPNIQVLFTSMVGQWGGDLVGLVIIITILATLLSWIGEVSAFTALLSQQKMFFRIFGHMSKKGVPFSAVLITGICEQIGLILILFNSNVYTFYITICMQLILIPFLFVALYFFKVTRAEDPKCARKTIKLLSAVYLLVFLAFGFFSTDFSYLLLSVFIYALGIGLYFIFIKKPLDEFEANKAVEKGANEGDANQ